MKHAVFNLLYAAPGDWMGAVFLVQILRVALIPAVTRTAVHFLTMRRCALTQQHATCNTERIQPSGTPRLSNVICASILRLCGINPAITKLFSIKNGTCCLEAQFLMFCAPVTFLRVKKLYCPLLLPQPTRLRIYVMDFWAMAPHNLKGGH